MGSFVWPVSTAAIITSPFGPRWGSFHYGTDLSYGGCNGDIIKAARAGKVTFAGSSGTYGNLVKISHGGGVETRYAHCSSFIVSAGDQVKAGQAIARIGTTGRSTGPHLHFEIRFNGTSKNPMNYVSKSDSVANFTGDMGTSSVSGSGSSGTKRSKAKEISQIKVVSTTGKQGAQDKSLRGKRTVLKDGCEVLIQSGSKVYQPELEGEITWSLERTGAAGKLEFNAIDDGTLKLKYGSPVRFKYFGKNVFWGYIFTIKPNGDTFSVTAYDQLRYFKNKDVMIYKKKTYSQLLKQIAKKYSLSCGTIVNTKYAIPKRIEEGTLFDILGNAADLTKKETGKTYILYDNFGKLNLRKLSGMRLNLLIDKSTAQSFEYEGTIDGETYNRIKLYTDSTKTGVRKVYIRNNTSKQNQWGILQYTEKASHTNKDKIKKETKTLMKKYARPEKKLSVSGCLGDVRVRPGCSLMVQIDAGMEKVNSYMYVEKATHKWSDDSYMMDLTLYSLGGEFDAE
nr:MAG TPA: 43 kDa tail protein [Caudoviricetes sp.]